MVITSMDINNKEFKKSLRGYDCDEVDEFLDKIAEDYELVYKENSHLKEKIELLEERLKHYSQIEATIQNTLILAQNAADQAKQSAKSEADLIIRQANEESQKIIDKAHNDVVKINDDYQSIKQEFLKFRAKFKNFMTTQLDTFDSLDREFMKNYNVGNIEDNDMERAQDISSIKVKGIEEKANVAEKLEERPQGLNDNDLSAIKSFFVKSDD